MLDVISDGFKKAKLKLQGKAELSEENIKEALEDVRQSLLEADVEYSVVKTFLNNVSENAQGKIVQLRAGKGQNKRSVRPADYFVQICQEELNNLMGPVDSELNFSSNKPTIIMMVGLQGSGKTTTVGKLAKYLVSRKKRKPLLVAADIYRPAAVDQLKVLGQRLNVPVFHVEGGTPVEICSKAMSECYANNYDTVILDTAGRLTIDETLMGELSSIKSALDPQNIILVCDAMMGQDAVTTAKSFDDRLDVTGFILTKLDGDARGGAALSIKQVTGKPIKFLGMGEDLDRLEEFRPEGLSSRILGMGDVLGLMKDFEQVVEKDSEEDAMRMMRGQFTFRDFYKQISMIQKMGPLKDIIAKLPMQNMLPKDLVVDDRELIKIKAMIDSMTEKERVNPKIMNDSRCRRIAGGSGRSPTEVTELVSKFNMMKNMIGMMSKNMGGLLGKIPGLGSLGQMGQMKQMAQQMMGGGGLGGGSPFGGLGGGGSPVKRDVDKDKLKKARKAAKAARKKNR